MTGLLLQTASLSTGDAGLITAVVALFAAFFVFAFIVGIAAWVFSSLAVMRIAKRTSTEPAWLAWIPIANIYLYSKMAGMHWWPLLLLAISWIPFLGTLAQLVLLVFFVVWWWNIFPKVGRPSWWAIFLLIPLVNLIFLGVAAWGADSSSQKPSATRGRKQKKKSRRKK